MGLGLWELVGQFQIGGGALVGQQLDRSRTPLPPPSSGDIEYRVLVLVLSAATALKASEVY